MILLNNQRLFQLIGFLLVVSIILLFALLISLYDGLNKRSVPPKAEIVKLDLDIRKEDKMCNLKKMIFT